MKYHRIIQFKPMDNFFLYLYHRLAPLNCCVNKFWLSQKKFEKVYAETNKKLKKSLNVVKIIRSLRELKILMNNSLLNDELRKYLRHAEKNLIDLESGSDSDGADR